MRIDGRDVAGACRLRRQQRRSGLLPRDGYRSAARARVPTGDRVARAVVIVNEEFVRRYFDGLEPIGRTHLSRRASTTDIPAEVVGVVANSKYRSSARSATPRCTRRFCRRPPDASLTCWCGRPDRPRRAIASSATPSSKADPDAAVSIEPMTTALAFAFLPSRIGAALVGSLGTLGTLLAMIGLYGVVSFAVTRRTARNRHPHGARRHASRGGAAGLPRRRHARRHRAGDWTGHRAHRHAPALGVSRGRSPDHRSDQLCRDDPASRR